MTMSLNCLRGSRNIAGVIQPSLRFEFIRVLTPDGLESVHSSDGNNDLLSSSDDYVIHSLAIPEDYWFAERNDIIFNCLYLSSE
jgi:hypothetical protein